MKTRWIQTWALLRSLLKWLVLLGIPLFVAGEQIETFRLGALAACESAKDSAVCMRQKGYLLKAPYYPDISRRALGGGARLLGGWMGATYAPTLVVEEE